MRPVQGLPPQTYISLLIHIWYKLYYFVNSNWKQRKEFKSGTFHVGFQNMAYIRLKLSTYFWLWKLPMNFTSDSETNSSFSYRWNALT